MMLIERSSLTGKPVFEKSWAIRFLSLLYPFLELFITSDLERSVLGVCSRSFCSTKVKEIEKTDSKMGFRSMKCNKKC